MENGFFFEKLRTEGETLTIVVVSKRGSHQKTHFE